MSSRSHHGHRFSAKIIPRESPSSNSPAVIGGTVGGVAFIILLLLVIGVWRFTRMRRARRALVGDIPFEGHAAGQWTGMPGAVLEGARNRSLSIDSRQGLDANMRPANRSIELPRQYGDMGAPRLSGELPPNPSELLKVPAPSGRGNSRGRSGGVRSKDTQNPKNRK
jgi:hypothetical protein